MMGVQPSEAMALTWWQYAALIWQWNDRHTPPDQQAVEAPDPAFVARRMERLQDAGLGRMVH